MSADPMARQAATLAALDRLIKIAEAANKSRWMADVAHVAPTRMRSGDDARYLISVTPGSVLPWLQGRRSILVRHGPEWLPSWKAWACERCRNEVGDQIPWEDCPDWPNASAGLEVPD